MHRHRSAAAWLQERIDRVFDQDRVRVEVSDEIVAQELAGAKRVRFRAGTRFSERHQMDLVRIEADYAELL